MYTLEVPLEKIINYIRFTNIPIQDSKYNGKLPAFMGIGAIKDYWQYAINYGFIQMGKSKSYIPNLITRYKEYSNKESLIYREISLNNFNDSDFIVFEFPDEETALYFKLKFVKE